MDDYFGVKGYEVYFTRYSNSILSDRFPEAKKELTSILDNFMIKKSLIIEGGGGKSKITQNLEETLYEYNWKKKIVLDEHLVDGKKVVSESHEIDHYKVFDNGSIGLEIEWNNKDPFYDRDLENFRKLHYINSIGLAIIVTRGSSLQGSFPQLYSEFLKSIFPFTIDHLKKHFRISDNLASAIVKEKILDKKEDEQIHLISKVVTSSKFGQATTHMEKLLLRLDRGLGNPCPFILIGIGVERII